jgi:hypothetical protein
MHHLAKAMMVAGMAAVGLPLLTGGADAQVLGDWNLIRPTGCYTFLTETPDGRVMSNLTVWTDTYNFTVTNDILSISTLFQFCHAGSPFYAYFATYSPTQFYVTPGLQ